MYLTLLKGKLHRAAVTHCERDYEGSCAIAEDLLRLAEIREYEQIQIYNVTNGERLTTYAIRAEAGSGVVSMNGAAAHKATVGDRVIICAYAQVEEARVAHFKPYLVYLDADNRVLRQAHAIPLQAA